MENKNPPIEGDLISLNIQGHTSKNGDNHLDSNQTSHNIHQQDYSEGHRKAWNVHQ